MWKTFYVPTLEKRKRSSEERMGPAKSEEIKNLSREKGG
jgi:hypothetical protein